MVKRRVRRAGAPSGGNWQRRCASSTWRGGLKKREGEFFWKWKRTWCFEGPIFSPLFFQFNYWLAFFFPPWPFAKGLSAA